MGYAEELERYSGMGFNSSDAAMYAGGGIRPGLDEESVTTEKPAVVARREYLRALAKRKDQLFTQRQWWKANTPPGDEHARLAIRTLNLLIGETAETIRKVEHNLLPAPMSYAVGTPPELQPGSTLRRAAQQMDWRQVVLNGGPPCFYLCADGHFCARAESWDGHRAEKGDVIHEFVSLADLLKGEGKA